MGRPSEAAAGPGGPKVRAITSAASSGSGRRAAPGHPAAPEPWGRGRRRRGAPPHGSARAIRSLRAAPPASCGRSPDASAAGHPAPAPTIAEGELGMMDGGAHHGRFGKSDLHHRPQGGDQGAGDEEAGDAAEEARRAEPAQVEGLAVFENVARGAGDHQRRHLPDAAADLAAQPLVAKRLGTNRLVPSVLSPRVTVRSRVRPASALAAALTRIDPRRPSDPPKPRASRPP